MTFTTKTKASEAEVLSSEAMHLREAAGKAAKAKLAFNQALDQTRRPVQRIVRLNETLREGEKRNDEHALRNEPIDDLTPIRLELQKANDDEKTYQRLMRRREIELKEANTALDKAAKAEHDRRYGDLLVRYIDALEVFLEETYRPMIECYLEDWRRLPALFSPFFDSSALVYTRSRVESFVRPDKPIPPKKGRVVVKFLKNVAGQTDILSGSLRTIPSYAEGKHAAFDERDARLPIDCGFAGRA